MYDKVKLWIDRGVLGADYGLIAQSFENPTEERNLTTGEVKTRGSISGLKVSLHAGGMSVLGSLPKFMYGNNIESLDRKTTATALVRLSDILHVDVSGARVTGLEFGCNFPMRREVKMYLERLGELPKMVRCGINGNSIYYRGRSKAGRFPMVLAFYDKVAESAINGVSVPAGLGGNMLRYEIRLKGRLNQQLNVYEVKASTLADISFYKNLVKIYQDRYFMIKRHHMETDGRISVIKTVSGAYDLLFARLLQQSDTATISTFIEELKQAGVFSDRKYYARLRRKIEKVASNKGEMRPDELIKELDDGIKNVGAYL